MKLAISQLTQVKLYDSLATKENIEQEHRIRKKPQKNKPNYTPYIKYLSSNQLTNQQWKLNSERLAMVL